MQLIQATGFDIFAYLTNIYEKKCQLTKRATTKQYGHSSKSQNIFWFLYWEA